MSPSLDLAAFNPSAQTLRKRTLDRLRIPEDSELERLGPQEIKHLIHELRVHQIELETQNENLRLAQEELEASRIRYSDLYDFAPVGYVLLNETGMILNANLTSATLLGVPRGALIKIQMARFILRDDQNIYYQHSNQLIETEIPQTFELRMIKKDETVFWARLQASLSHDSSGPPVLRIVLSDITEQKQVERALQESELRESENRFRKLFEQHSAVILVLDAENGKIFDANEAAVQFYGWSLEELQQMSIHEINTLPAEVVQAAMRKAASLKNTRFEFCHRRADGSIRDVEVFSNRIESAGRKYLYSIIHDISWRKQTEKKLQENREELQIILDSSPIMIFFKDCENRFIRVNKALAEVTGLPKEEMEGKTVFEIYPNQVKDYWEDDKEVIASGEPKIGIIEPIEGATGRRWLQTDKIPCRDKDGCIVGIIGFSIDITERRQAEAALKESEDRFRTLADAIPQLCWMANAECWIFWYNQRWYEYTGTTPEQMEGWGWQSVHDPEILPQVLEQWQESIATGKLFDMVFPLRGSDGLFRSFLTRVVPISDQDGKVVCWFGTNTDITEREQAEIALRESEERYRSLFNLMLEGFCIIEVQFDADNRPVDYRFLEVNPAFEKQTGLHNVQGKMIRELIPENEAYWFEIYGKVALTGESRRFLNEVKTLNRWYDVSAYRIGGRDSRRVAILFSDITESKRTEATLKKLNEELELRVLERTQDLAGFIEKLQGEIADREKAEESLQRLNRLYVMLSKTNHAIVRTKDRDALFKDFCRIAVKNGKFKLAWIGLVDEETDGLRIVASSGATGYLEDIRITIIDEPEGLGPTGISVRDGTYTICNDFLCSPLTRPWQKKGRAYGIRASASIALKQEGRVIGALTLYADQKDFFDRLQVGMLKQMGTDISFALDIFVREARRRKAEQALREETAERIRVEEEIRILNTELEQRVIDRTTQLVAAHKESQETNNRLRSEIEGRKKAEEALRQSEKKLLATNDELERRVERRTQELQETQSHFLHAEKLSAVGKLSASIAHEFNNPLQGIMSILKGVKKRAILEEEDRELLDAAILESERMKNLIRSLQDFNRPSSGQKSVINVHLSLDSLLLLCKNDFKNKRISVIRNYAEGLPHILGVPDQIKQVFLNLLTNAADACIQPGGVITVSTWQEEQRVAVAITDTGIGISSDKIDLIFQPFYTTKPAVKGTGLGLSVCHGIIQKHQGEIRVESQPGKGASFIVLLPAKEE